MICKDDTPSLYAYYFDVSNRRGWCYCGAIVVSFQSLLTYLQYFWQNACHGSTNVLLCSPTFEPWHLWSQWWPFWLYADFILICRHDWRCRVAFGGDSAGAIMPTENLQWKYSKYEQCWPELYILALKWYFLLGLKSRPPGISIPVDKFTSTIV